NQQNEEIQAQRDRLEELNERLNKQNSEIEKLYNIAIARKEEAEAQKEEITDSINYGLRIQNAVLPDSIIMNEYLQEHFVLYKPKDIVSGDFYWTYKNEKQTLIAVADCTGHGVPGAFMSILGITLLNEIIQVNENANPGNILNALRDEIIHALKQKGISGEQKEGMDISLLSFDTDQKECQWAGANNPLWIVEPTDSGTYSLIEIKADKMPVAIHPKMDSFTNHKFETKGKSKFYLFTDGYADLFGGKNGKKLKTKGLKDFILQNAHIEIRVQKEIFDTFLTEWMNNSSRKIEQIDDICLLGIER
ncbi:MAG: hypothetical protein C0594_15415, partial [Marinilabiliales bacterium]